MNILTTYEKKPEKIEKKKKMAIEKFTDGLCQNEYNH